MVSKVSVLLRKRAVRKSPFRHCWLIGASPLGAYFQCETNTGSWYEKERLGWEGHDKVSGSFFVVTALVALLVFLL